ncbi:MAG: N-acetyl-1-D-myo-inositol-2-amino-2-deoxy-alpha-D-glucopyranoside deacetylase [Ktedonobacteraceae bacterium]|nr:N-acetyl-1-D-myo-inositol-2-amino-2-deoxy-alpha-D-glucopyranoside deacetylase [Ktedonobacteraceae bacterium]
MTKQPEYTFMAVHAHPDDEVFGTGGTFALLAARGVRTVLVTATGGEEGEIVDPDLDEAAKQAMFPRLAEVRREELLAAAHALNISELRNLGFRDSGMAGTEANNHPDSFHRAVFHEAVRRLVAIIREMRPQVIVTYDPFGSYGHPDHIQAHRVTLAAFEAAGEARCFPELQMEAWQPAKLYYAVSSRSGMASGIKAMREQGIPGPWDNPDMNLDLMGTPDYLITTRIDVRAHNEQKIQAFRAHKTQIAPDGFMFTLPEEARQNFLGYEHFMLAHRAPASHSGDLEQDLFDGLD